MAGPYDFTGQNIENTYQRVIQTPDGVTFYNGTGSLVILPSANTSSLLTTASVNLNTITFTKGDGSTFPITVNTGSGGSGTPTFPYTGSAIISGSLTITGSLNAPSITGSLFGTSSWAQSASVAISSSYSSTASYALNGGVTKILAGANVNISPINGLGDVTVTSFGTNLYNTATGSYGSFFDTGSVSATSATAIYSMSLNTTDISNGVFISASNGDNTRVKFTNAGIYNLQFSSQFSNTDNSIQDVFIWVKKNGVDIPDSSGVVSVPPFKAGSNGQVISGWNYFLNLSANDFIQMCWHVEQANVVTLETIPAGVGPTHPRTPSTILTANRVDTFLSNTGSFSGSFTGNLTGTASYATTASYALNAGVPGDGNTSIQFNSGSRFSGSQYFQYIYQSQSLQQGFAVTASGLYSHAQGSSSKAQGDYSHAEGQGTFAVGPFSHAEGLGVEVYAAYSHGEGRGTGVYAEGSHAEGYYSTTTAVGSHAEGYQTRTEEGAVYAHAEGYSTIAYGTASHAGGAYTIASGSYQTVVGQYNKHNNTTDLFVIGNGSDDANRSDILNVSTSSIAMSSSVNISGSLTINGSLVISGSVTADNLWYRYTLTNLPLDTAGTYTIVPVTPGYKFVPLKAADPSSLYNTTCQLENNSDTNTVIISISNFIRVGNTLDQNALGKFTPGGGGTSLAPNQIIAGFDLAGGNSYMVSIDTNSIIVTIDGSGGDIYPIDITITGYLKKI